MFFNTFKTRSSIGQSYSSRPPHYKILHPGEVWCSDMLLEWSRASLGEVGYAKFIYLNKRPVHSSFFYFLFVSGCRRWLRMDSIQQHYTFEEYNHCFVSSSHDNSFSVNLFVTDMCCIGHTVVPCPPHHSDHSLLSLNSIWYRRLSALSHLPEQSEKSNSFSANYKNHMYHNLEELRCSQITKLSFVPN